MSGSDPFNLVIIAGIILAFLYWFSIRTHPMAKCRVCNGRGFFRHPIFRWAKRPCRHCVRGNVRRLGARGPRR